MRSSVVVAALSALLVSAQNSTFKIDVNKVPATQKAQWCSAQTATCGTLCNSSPNDNSCNPPDLTYSCTCQNGSAPGLQYYTQTIDTFVCQQAFQVCNEANVGNAKGQENCTHSIQDHCGSLNPADYKAAPATTGPSGSSPSSPASTPPSARPANASSQAPGPVQLQYLGTGVLAAGMGVLAYLL